MYEWQKDSFIIDTPWIRNLDFLEFEKSEISNFFSEFEDFKINCKFNDCSHISEPNCAVKDAVNSWKISEFRYKSYLRLLNEIK